MINLPGMKRDVSLAPLTTYKIGGQADYFFEANDQSHLADAVIKARKAQLPFFVLGSGANILMGDKGFRGLVIHNQAQNYQIKNHDLVVESGATIAELINITRAKSLSGLEHFIGIPSSVGGAIWQNLHFLSPDRKSTLYIGDILISAKILDEQNQLMTVDRDFFEFGYDDSILHHRQLIVLEATFRLSPSDPETIKRQAELNMEWRNAKQPQLHEYASCGSVFQKIKDAGAGRLIDQAGLKGHRVGNIQVSDKHANYLINLGGGKASEVRELISHIQAVVLEKTGHKLMPEISFIGEF